MRLSARVVRLGVVCLVLLAFGTSTTARAATGSVTIAGFAFAPSTITVNVGDSVRWTNADAAPHSAVHTGTGAFDTGVLAQGQAGTVTFTTAGTFSYICGVHGASMSGTVVVVAATPSPATAPPTPAPATAPPTQAPTAVPTSAPTTAPAAPTAAATPAPTAAAGTTAPAGAGGYEDPYGGTPPDASASSSAATGTPTGTAVAAAQPTASAAVASATASDGGAVPVAVGIGALALVAIAGAAWRLLRR